MNVYRSRWLPAGDLATGNRFSDPAPRFRMTAGAAAVPVSQQVLSWLLFWPLLSLIARQAVYFAGPARTAEAYQNGADMAGPRGSHYSLYVNLAFLLMFVIAGHQHVWLVLKKNRLICGMLALAVVSACWSAVPAITLQMCVAASLCALFACYLAVRVSTDQLMQLLVFMGVCSAFLSILFALALPRYGIFQGYAGGAWQGICTHKNALGSSMAFLLTPIFFTDAYSLRRKSFYVALMLFLIYESQSRGAWAYTAGMLLCVGWLHLVRRVRERELKLFLLLTIASGIAMVVSILYFWPILAASVGKDPTMTGRTGIYAEIWRSVVKHPILGYGFGGFWYTGSPERQRIGIAIGWPNIGYAESGLLEIGLQLGIVGVGLIVAMLLKALLQGARLLRSPHYSPRVGWFLTILFLAALTNIDAGWFLTADSLDWVLILISCIGLNEEAKRLSFSMLS